MSEEEVKADLRGRLEAAVTSEAATVTPRCEADNRRNNRRNLRDIWAQFVTCLRPDPESAVADPGGGHGDDRTADKRDVKKSVWSYRPYDVF